MFGLTSNGHSFYQYFGTNIMKSDDKVMGESIRPLARSNVIRLPTLSPNIKKAKEVSENVSGSMSTFKSQRLVT
jgi:hypothetical protein